MAISVNFNTTGKLVKLRDDSYVPEFSSGESIEGRVLLTLPVPAPAVGLIECWLSSEVKLHYFPDAFSPMIERDTRTQLTGVNVLAPIGDEDVKDGMTTLTFPFSFPNMDLPLDSYYGDTCTLRFILIVKYNDIMEESEFLVVNHYSRVGQPKKLRIPTVFPGSFVGTLNVNLSDNTFFTRGPMKGSFSVQAENCKIGYFGLVIGRTETIIPSPGEDPIEFHEVIDELDWRCFTEGIDWNGNRGRRLLFDLEDSLSETWLTPSYPDLVYGLFSVEYYIRVKYTVVENAMFIDDEADLEVEKDSDDDDVENSDEEEMDFDNDWDCDNETDDEEQVVDDEYEDPRKLKIEEVLSPWNKVTLIRF